MIILYRMSPHKIIILCCCLDLHAVGSSLAPGNQTQTSHTSDSHWWVISYKHHLNIHSDESAFLTWLYQSVWLQNTMFPRAHQDNYVSFLTVGQSLILTTNCLFSLKNLLSNSFFSFFPVSGIIIFRMSFFLTAKEMPHRWSTLPSK